MNCESVKTEIVDFLKNKLFDSSCKEYVVGVSGGIDSALTSTLCAEAGLPTIAVSMPVGAESNQDERAKSHQSWLTQRYNNVTAKKVDLTEAVVTFDESVLKPQDLTDDLVKVNLQARLRMSTLYAFANQHSYLVAGTGNKVEDFGVGYFTKYGDGGVDLLPIADLLKTEVRELADHLGIQREIIEATPSDGLWEDNRSDEEQIGLTYPEMERYMEWQDQGKAPDEVGGEEKKKYETYLQIHRKNQHKMDMPPVCDLSEVKED